MITDMTADWTERNATNDQNKAAKRRALLSIIFLDKEGGNSVIYFHLFIVNSKPHLVLYVEINT